MTKLWANNKLVQSWDRAVIAVGGVALGVFMAVTVIWGDPTSTGIDIEALERVEIQMQCVPDEARSPLVQQSEHC